MFTVGFKKPESLFEANRRQELRLSKVVDEYVVSGLVYDPRAEASPYMPLMFMRREPLFRRYYSMKDATAAELKRWRDSFVYFCKKIQLAAGGSHKRLLLKSPVHTARVNLFHAMFPKATFIFIHRHPYEVGRCLRSFTRFVHS